MCPIEVWPSYKVRRTPRRRSTEVTSKRRSYANSDSASLQQTVEAMRLLWLAIGRDPDVQSRVMQLLQEVRKEAGYEEED